MGEFSWFAFHLLMEAPPKCPNACATYENISVARFRLVPTRWATTGNAKARPGAFAFSKNGAAMVLTMRIRDRPATKIERPCASPERMTLQRCTPGAVGSLHAQRAEDFG